MSATDLRTWWTKTQHWPANGRTKAAEGYIAALEAEIGHLAAMMRQLDTGGTFETMTCSEVDALADVIRLVDPECAEFVIAQHAEGDDEGDSHYQTRS